MLIGDYRALQRTDLRDTGTSDYFTDVELDGFHQRALRQYARWHPLTKPLDLSIPAGQTVTTLPADFIDPDPATFLAAVGAVPCAPGGYADVYAQSEAFQAPTGGMDGFSSAYGSYGLGYLFFPSRPTTATILEGNPPSLMLDPAPARAIAAKVLYQADYAMPTDSVAGSLADRNSDIILNYACHLACEAMLSDPTLLQSYKVAYEAVNRSRLVDAIAGKSQRKLAAFNSWTASRPLGSMG